MKTTVYNNDFIRAFEELRPDNFSRAGLNTLFDMLEEFEEDTETEIELDVIAICCQFTEYTIKELAADYKWASGAISEALAQTDAEELDADEYHDVIESALDRIGAYYRWIDDDSLILDIESF